MQSSRIYHSITIDNPGYVYKYWLRIYKSYVQISIDSPLPFHFGSCRLTYKIQDEKITWLQQQKTLQYSAQDNLRVIQFLRNLPRNVIQGWRSYSVMIPLMPSDILRRLEEVEQQQISQPNPQQQQIILKNRKRYMFAQSQRKQIQKGNLECIICAEVLKKSHYTQFLCGHCFHYPCIQEYHDHNNKNQCPICKYTPN